QAKNPLPKIFRLTSSERFTRPESDRLRKRRLRRWGRRYTLETLVCLFGNQQLNETHMGVGQGQSQESRTEHCKPETCSEIPYGAADYRQSRKECGDNQSNQNERSVPSQVS